MDLPPQVQELYRTHFREVRTSIGSSLSAVLRHHGSLDQKLWKLLNRIQDWRQRGTEPLHEADRFIAAYWGAHGYIQNDGFEGFFENSSGDYWQDLLRVLSLGNAPDGEQHFRRVLAHFPNSSPSTQHEIRKQQVAQLEQDKQNWDSVLNAEYDDLGYPSEETLFRALSAIDEEDFVPDLDAPA